MDYKELYKKAFSSVTETYPCSDHETAFRNVTERSKAMSKTERAKQMTFADDYAEYAKSKKPHTALKVVGGIAGTAAVLAGAVFGLSWLNEHGGLKGPDVQGAGEGYNETTSSENDATSGGMFLTQSDKDLLEGNAYPAVDIPEGTRYDFNGFYVEPRWCTFDGMTLLLAYDIVYEGEMPSDIDNSVRIESEGGLISGYLLNRSDSRVVMKASVYYPGIVHSTKVDLVSEADGTRYTFTADIPEGVHLFSADLLGTDIPINDTGITKKLIHIDASSSGISLTFENKPEERGIAAQLEPKTIIKLTDGTEIRPTGIISAQDWYERQEGDKLYIRFITQSFDPSDIDEIRVNDIIVYLSSRPAEAPSIQDSFAELYETNNDIVGWIRIGSTDDPVIDYPVVQAEDNDYYLTHNVFKDKVERGAIFADFRNNFDKGLLSGNTVLYGHNMWYGDKMFANLTRYYEDSDSNDNLRFYKENPTVTFNTLYENAEWKVFACALFNTQEEKGEVYPYNQILDFADADEFNSFITDIMDRSVLCTDVDLTYGDSILTLSTFYYPFGPDTDTRVAVFARKVRPGESSEVDVSKASRNPNPLKFEYQYQIEGGSWDGSIGDKSDEVVDFLANIEQLVNSSEQIEELKQLLLKIEGVADVQVYNSDDDSKNTEIQITEGKVEKGMVVKVFYDNGESWVQYTKQ